jgi:hypothetical protein
VDSASSVVPVVTPMELSLPGPYKMSRFLEQKFVLALPLKVTLTIETGTVVRGQKANIVSLGPTTELEGSVSIWYDASGASITLSQSLPM